MSVAGTGDGAPPSHPLARAIEDLYAAGTTPRLMIDARRLDVIVPDFLRAKWAERLVIDLDAAYPLDLAMDDAGVHANLAFSGAVTRCTFGWSSIYRVIDRANGRGIMIPAHEPPAELAAELLHASVGPRPGKPALAAVPPTPRDDATPASASDDEAKARRAKFRVIEGG